MGGFLRLLMFLAVAIGSLTFIVYHVSEFFLSVGSVNKMIRRDFAKLKNLISEFVDGLVPLTGEEIRLLSANPISKIKRRGIYSTASGYLSTIYQEPLFAFGIKKYNKTGKVIMLVKSESDEYKFYFDNKHTKLYKNDLYDGYITMDDVLMSNHPQELAKIQYQAGQKYAVIYSNNEDVAHLNLTDSDGNPLSERAFSAFHDFQEKSADNLIYLSLYHLLFKRNLYL